MDCITRNWILGNHYLSNLPKIGQKIKKSIVCNWSKIYLFIVLEKKTRIMYPGFGYPNHHYEVRKASKGLYTQINPFTTIYSHNFREDLEARARKIECPS